MINASGVVLHRHILSCISFTHAAFVPMLERFVNMKRFEVP